MTPVVVHPAWPASAVTEPLAATLSTWTAHVFGFAIRRTDVGAASRNAGARRRRVTSDLEGSSTATARELGVGGGATTENRVMSSSRRQRRR